ncbi:MAG: putative permease [Granulosicoccus sp.]|jgi:predicted permease
MVGQSASTIGSHEFEIEDKMRTILTLILSLISTVSVWAKGNDIEMAEMMRSEGKIYIVIGVLMIIFIGFIFYLIRLDSRITKMEKEFDN